MTLIFTGHDQSAELDTFKEHVRLSNGAIIGFGYLNRSHPSEITVTAHSPDQPELFTHPSQLYEPSNH